MLIDTKKFNLADRKGAYNAFLRDCDVDPWLFRDMDPIQYEVGFNEFQREHYGDLA